MPHKQLHATLSALHEQLQGDKPLDGADKAHLKEVLSEIEEALDTDGPHEGVSDRVNEAIARFETSYPTIATGLHEVVDLLKRL